MNPSFQRRWTRAALAAGLCCILSLSVGLAPSAQAATQGGTLVVVTTPEPNLLTNALSSAVTVTEVGTKVYDGLLEYDMEMRPVPSLAESWEVSPDGKTVVFKLRHGVTWHDGRPFTSADVQFSLLQVVKLYHARGPGNLGPVTAIETPDEHTAVFRLEHPYPPLLKGLSSAEAPILPKHLYEGTDIRNNPANNAPVGTGPFMFKSWDRGSAITLVRNPNYWREGRPYLDRLIFRFIGDSGTRSAVMENGEAQVATFGSIVPAEMKRLASLPDLEIAEGGYEALAPILSLEINNKRPPLDNRKVRQAIAYAIDRKFIADNIWFGFGKPAVGPISSVYASSGIFTDSGIVRYDVADRIERAKRLLDEAGFPEKEGGVRFSLVHDVSPYGEDYRRLGEYLRQALGKIGIKVTLRNEDWGAWVRRIYTDYDYDFTSGWFVGMGDPTLGAQRLYVSRTIKSGIPFNNATRYSDPEIDGLWERVAVEQDAAKRNEAFHQIQRKLTEDSPLIWLLELHMVSLQSKQVKGLITSPLGMRGGLYEASLEK
ncbi:ABC transporter substrate-binding protein [Castellaniella sp. GW247-6E4]|uniref:ABC transporter substrate-binding protein n=1 Tax=Castellaniella sp. GW247-6E4 TaxID=3140380 RepID=UPI0033150002